ncbi:MAG: type II secretion system protein [Alphaproteobacteria bacterium]|nr:type II secretion system protein [Alphaproteobacteria bacterium]
MKTFSRIRKAAVAGAARFGFSLLEMTLVMMILAMVASMFLTTAASKINEKKKDITLTHLQEVQDALVSFRQANHRLPCPAAAALNISSSSYGREAANNNANCTGGSPAADVFGNGVAIGTVPTKNLGLPDDDMYDGWGNKLTYGVDTRATVDCAFTKAYAAITDTSTVFITVNDANGNPRTTNAWFVLVSHGQNGHGAFLPSGSRYSNGSVNANELLNCHCKSTGTYDGGLSQNLFVDQLTTENAANPLNRFDDILKYGERMHLRNKDDEAGTTETCP